MELSPSGRAANSAATQEFLSILWNSKVHYRVHKSPPLVPILTQIYPIHTIQSYLSKIHSNIAHHLRLGLPCDLFPSSFPTNILYAFLRSSEGTNRNKKENECISEGTNREKNEGSSERTNREKNESSSERTNREKNESSSERTNREKNASSSERTNREKNESSSERTNRKKNERSSERTNRKHEKNQMSSDKTIGKRREVKGIQKELTGAKERV
ncbi:hypothetical protein B7P43_G05969 [Cryptotermes secundus]|uniref:Uncharacterized protein n=1 Tax=Cryptotermes secundus TaxID=105785 RepID=A0A2J7PZS6_9NEOP|nr:hypothetical protein B7P43_G05969 [Cryptotermes secundus]